MPFLTSFTCSKETNEKQSKFQNYNLVPMLCKFHQNKWVGLCRPIQVKVSLKPCLRKDTEEIQKQFLPFKLIINYFVLFYLWVMTYYYRRCPNTCRRAPRQRRRGRRTQTPRPLGRCDHLHQGYCNIYATNSQFTYEMCREGVAMLRWILQHLRHK
jgi:hypothetical protein